MDKKVMLAIIIGILLVGAFLVVRNVNGKTSGYAISQEDVENLHEVRLSIDNMYCEACAYGVKAQLEELDGVVNAEINYQEANGVVLYDANKVNAQTVAEASTVYTAHIVEDKKLE